MLLSDRQQKLISTIIDTYVKTAEPVSSGLIGKAGGLAVSPATIRNEMNELEHLGYLVQLHTSGGRIPTDKAYRYHVDRILAQEDLEPDASLRKKIDLALDSLEEDPEEISKAVAKLVSELSDSLVIANVLDGRDFFKIGLSELFEHPEFQEFDKAFRLTSFFDDFEKFSGAIEREFFRNLEERIFPNLRIMIGRENPIEPIKDETVMLARYHLPHSCMGSLTIIGPTRMDYEKNISLVRYLTEELNKIY
jgi:transcriptional regulator of heat shock response